MSPLIVAIGWAVIGAAAGILVRWVSVKLARLEALEPGHKSWQVFGPSVLCALLFLTFGFELSGSLTQLVLDSVFVLVLVQVIFFDLEHQLILDRVIFPSIGLALVVSLLKQPWWAGIATGLGAGALFLIIGVVGSALFRAEALGAGDAKLAIFMGLLLGPIPTLHALFIGVVLAGVFATGYAIWRRSMKGNIALGPFLAVGTVLALLGLG